MMMDETTDAGSEARTTLDGSASDKFAHLSAFQRDLLHALDQRGPAKGLAVKDAIADYYGEEINNGRLYPNLDALAEGGLIEKRIREADGRTNEYELTELGRRALSARRAWTGGASA
ncbi:DNA-binding PadR family transcriptional regulator [Halarchaeum solikamskense]|nr:DNA-binding PadR family transcriptional regulator [Halarchaeum solikamskense]